MRALSGCERAQSEFPHERLGLLALILETAQEFMPTKVFISYSHEDVQKADKVYTAMAETIFADGDTIELSQPVQAS